MNDNFPVTALNWKLWMQVCITSVCRLGGLLTDRRSAFYHCIVCVCVCACLWAPVCFVSTWGHLFSPWSFLFSAVFVSVLLPPAVSICARDDTACRRREEQSERERESRRGYDLLEDSPFLDVCRRSLLHFSRCMVSTMNFQYCDKNNKTRWCCDHMVYRFTGAFCALLLRNFVPYAKWVPADSLSLLYILFFFYFSSHLGNRVYFLLNAHPFPVFLLFFFYLQSVICLNDIVYIFESTVHLFTYLFNVYCLTVIQIVIVLSSLNK